MGTRSNTKIRLGARIRRTRERLRQSQTQLASKAGIRQSHLSEIESGESFPSLLTMMNLSTALKRESLDYLCFGRRRRGSP